MYSIFIILSVYIKDLHPTITKQIFFTLPLLSPFPTPYSLLPNYNIP